MIFFIVFSCDKEDNGGLSARPAAPLPLTARKPPLGTQELDPSRASRPRFQGARKQLGLRPRSIQASPHPDSSAPRPDSSASRHGSKAAPDASWCRSCKPSRIRTMSSCVMAARRVRGSPPSCVISPAGSRISPRVTARPIPQPRRLGLVSSYGLGDQYTIVSDDPEEVKRQVRHLVLAQGYQDGCFRGCRA